MPAAVSRPRPLRVQAGIPTFSLSRAGAATRAGDLHFQLVLLVPCVSSLGRRKIDSADVFSKITNPPQRREELMLKRTLVSHCCVSLTTRPHHHQLIFFPIYKKIMRTMCQFFLSKKVKPIVIAKSCKHRAKNTILKQV